MTVTSTAVANTYLGLSLEAWIGMLIAIVAFFGVAGWSLVRTLRQDDRKMKLVKKQERIDTYSPKALEDLRTWIEDNPGDPLVEDAKEKYNECVAVLKEKDEYFYDWSDDEVESLEKL